jgi:hypothetical protein
MGEHSKILGDWGARIKGLKKEKKNTIIAISILILSMGVFFYPAPKAWFVMASNNQGALCLFKKGILCPKNHELGVLNKERKPAGEEIISLESLTPVHKIGSFTYQREEKVEKKQANNCASAKKITPNSELDANMVLAMVAGHPIEKMASYILKRDKKVGSFLVAIAKKESDWGLHSPLKAGRDCYNYWGYRGGYNMTESGYSCFDSPEQAIAVVGDRIEDLLEEQINTPVKMIVWKCGRTCAGHDPAGVAKWISDVDLYYGKLNS